MSRALATLLEAFERGEITERCLSFLLAMLLWDRVEEEARRRSAA